MTIDSCSSAAALLFVHSYCSSLAAINFGSRLRLICPSGLSKSAHKRRAATVLVLVLTLTRRLIDWSTRNQNQNQDRSLSLGAVTCRDCFSLERSN